MEAAGFTAKSDRARVFGLFVFFLLVIAAFWVQKPIRSSRFLAEVGAASLPWVKLGTAILLLPVVLLYSALGARYRREYLVYICVATFSAASLAFWWLFTGASATWVHWAYFFYVDIFNSVLVALFWSFANDVSSPEEARRNYGFIGAGGIIGGALGSAFTGWTVESLGSANLLLVCVALLAGVAGAAGFVARRETRDAAPKAQKARASLRDAVNGARLTWQSSYLTYIALIVVLYEICSNVIDYQFNTFVAERYSGEAQMASFLGRFGTASIAASAAAQFLLTTWILRRWGPPVGLLVLPFVLALGSGALLLVPVFAVAASTFFADATLSYSLNQASKEVLYTPTDDAEKYQAKAFIDMFSMRFAKGVGSLAILAWMAWAPGKEHSLALLTLAAIAGWLLAARAAGRLFVERTQPGAGQQPSPIAARAPRLAPEVRLS